MDDEQEKPLDRGKVEALHPELAPNEPNIAGHKEVRYWLEWQSRMISGVISGGIFLLSDSAATSQYDQVVLPHKASNSDLLREYANETIQVRKPLVYGSVADAESLCDVVAHPLKRHDVLVGAVVFTLSHRDETQRESVQQLMQWCVVWLENLLESRVNPTDNESEAQLHAVNLFSTDAPLEVTGYQVCSHLANELDCSVVSLGLTRGWEVRVLAVSNQMEFDRRTHGITELEFAMQECADQDTAISLYPNHADLNVITKSHSQLLKNNAEKVVCSVPIRTEHNLIGVLTLVKSNGTPFTAKQRRKIDSLAACIGPILKLQTRANQSVIEKVRYSGLDFYQKLLDRQDIKLKTITALLVVIPLLLLVVPAKQRITATASLEGSMQRAIVAPVDGYIKTVYAQAGDTVAEGQSLVALDNNDLSLRYEQRSSERDKLTNEYQLAWANRDKPQIAILSARLAQSEAQLALIESEMSKSEITAPFGGQLISGDLSHLAGTPVKQGQLLFELVPLTGFTLTLDVNEYDVGKLADGQEGVLRLTARPNDSIDFTVQKALPVASIKQDQSVFRIEATLENPPPNLRPGMQGVGKVVVGSSSIGAVWTQSLRERLRMIAWYFGF